MSEAAITFGRNVRTSPKIGWTCKHFDQLTPGELYAILQLRNQIFVVEQNCVFQDADGKDQTAWHLMAFDSGSLVGYSRILPAGVFYPEASIGRVVTAQVVRGSGVGRELMRRSIECVRELFGSVPVRIGAQRYLKEFYKSFGFVQYGEPYREDGIWHISMVLAL